MSKRHPDAWGGVAHARIRHDVLFSPAWHVLGASSKALYVDLRARLKSTNNGNISAPLSELKHVGWRSSHPLANALFELEALGFIAKTRQGGIRQGSRVCTLYRFTDHDVLEQPKVGIPASAATFGYRQFEAVRDAERHLSQQLAARRKAAEAERTKKNPPVQKVQRSAAQSAVVKPLYRSTMCSSDMPTAAQSAVVRLP
jgi:hypothetical protein